MFMSPVEKFHARSLSVKIDTNGYVDIFVIREDRLQICNASPLLKQTITYHSIESEVYIYQYLNSEIRTGTQFGQSGLGDKIGPIVNFLC